jgi:hypothetical protein
MEQVYIPYDYADIYFTIYSIVNSKRIFTEAQLLDTLRKQVEPYVFGFLERKYGPLFDSYWQKATIPKESDKAIVIVERRCHPNLKFCIQNAAFFARDHSIHIVCSKANYDFVRHVCGPQVDNVHIHMEWDTIGTPEEGKLDYNHLLKTERFWQIFKEDYILTLETDSYLRRPISESIYKYDYVASKWPWLPDQPGGGGLSLRKRSAMLHICEMFPPEMDPMQDSFASYGVSRLKLKSPSMEESEHYFCEADITDLAIGTHQWWTFVAPYTPSEVMTIIQIMTTLYVG